MLNKARTFLVLDVVLTVLAGLGLVAQHACRPEPRYCWLTFGPGERVRLLVRLDGDAVRLQRFQQDRPVGPEQGFRTWWECRDVEVLEDEGTSYVLRRLGGLGPGSGGEPHLMAFVDVRGPVSYGQYSDAPLTAREPAAAPVCHFHGPLTARVVGAVQGPSEALVLRRGDQPTDLPVMVGTFDPARQGWVVVKSTDWPGPGDKAFPPDVRPVADVVFRPRSPGELRRRYPLAEVC